MHTDRYKGTMPITTVPAERSPHPAASQWQNQGCDAAVSPRPQQLNPPKAGGQELRVRAKMFCERPSRSCSLPAAPGCGTSLSQREASALPVCCRFPER